MERKELKIGQYYAFGDHPVKVIGLQWNDKTGISADRAEIRLNDESQEGAYMTVDPSRLAPLSPLQTKILSWRKGDRYTFVVQEALRLERENTALKEEIAALKEAQS